MHCKEHRIARDRRKKLALMYTIYIYQTQQYMDRSACFLNTANFRVVVYFDYTRCVNYTNKYIYTPKIGTYERIQHCCKQNSNRELIHEILHLKVKSMNITGYTSARHRVSEILTFSCWWQTYYTYDPLPLLWICFIQTPIHIIHMRIFCCRAVEWVFLETTSTLTNKTASEFLAAVAINERVRSTWWKKGTPLSFVLLWSCLI